MTYFQEMVATTPGAGPYLCGVEKTVKIVDYATALVRHDALKPGDLLIIDAEVLAAVIDSGQPDRFQRRSLLGPQVHLPVPRRAGSGDHRTAH